MISFKFENDYFASGIKKWTFGEKSGRAVGHLGVNYCALD